MSKPTITALGFVVFKNRVYGCAVNQLGIELRSRHIIEHAHIARVFGFIVAIAQFVKRTQLLHKLVK